MATNNYSFSISLKSGLLLTRLSYHKYRPLSRESGIEQDAIKALNWRDCNVTDGRAGAGGLHRREQAGPIRIGQTVFPLQGIAVAWDAAPSDHRITVFY